MKKMFYQVTVADPALPDGYDEETKTGQMLIANYDNSASVYANLKAFFNAAIPEPSKDTAFSIVRQIVNIADKAFKPDFVGCDEDIPLYGSQYKRIHFKCTPLQDY